MAHCLEHPHSPTWVVRLLNCSFQLAGFITEGGFQRVMVCQHVKREPREKIGIKAPFSLLRCIGHNIENMDFRELACHYRASSFCIKAPAFPVYILLSILTRALLSSLFPTSLQGLDILCLLDSCYFPHHC